jgi:hypothetical protein
MFETFSILWISSFTRPYLGVFSVHALFCHNDFWLLSIHDLLWGFTEDPVNGL